MYSWDISVEKKDFRIKDRGILLFVIRISGSLDAYTFPNLEETIQRLFEGDNYNIIINMERLNYISSAGLGVLMSMVKKLREKDGDIKLTNLPHKIHGILDLLGFTTVLEIYTEEEEAAKAFLHGSKKEQI